MIEAEHTIQIDAGIETVWDYVRDIRKWANLFPGCQDCEVIDDQQSRWTIKVGAGGLVKTVNVLVNVDQWDGPGNVNFSYQLKSEPVVGHGSYSAQKLGANATGITLKLHVKGSGQMAPMWEAMCRPLLPQLAKSFGSKLKAQIEGVASTPVKSSGLLASIGRWLRGIWRAIFGLREAENQQYEIDMSEQNRQVALKFLDAMGSGDGETAASCLAENAFTLTRGFCKFSGERDARAMVEMIGQFKHIIPTGLRLKFTSVTSGENRVVVEAQGNAVTGQGDPYCNQYCFVFTMENGNIRQLNEYFCTKLAEDVLWPVVQAMENQRPSA